MYVCTSFTLLQTLGYPNCLENSRKIRVRKILKTPPTGDTDSRVPELPGKFPENSSSKNPENNLLQATTPGKQI